MVMARTRQPDMSTNPRNLDRSGISNSPLVALLHARDDLVEGDLGRAQYPPAKRRRSWHVAVDDRTTQLREAEGAHVDAMTWSGIR